MYQRLLNFGLLTFLCLLVGVAQARDLPQFAELVRQNGPAVVNISTTQKEPSIKMLPDGLRNPDSEELFDELFKRFFDYRGGGGGAPFDFDSASRGSGFILSEDGYVVTNHHVVSGADEIKVKLNDRRELTAKLVGSDERTDVALLKIDAKGLPTLKMGDSDQSVVGEWVLAIGSPFGFDHSATSGIISATGRHLPNDTYVPFIQTDVAINPGNSGGPLFNLDGEVIGINSQIYSRSGGFMGVSFAIPVNVAMDVINQLKDKGRVSRGWLGVYIQDVDKELAQSFNMESPTGALVAQVIEGGPSVGVLRLGDVIIEFDGHAIDSAAMLPSMVGMTVANKKVSVKIIREGKTQDVQLTIGELPTDDKSSTKPELKKPESQDKELLGMALGELDEASLEALGLTNGVLIEKVVADPARKSGLQAGDVITLIDGKRIESPEQLREVIAGFSKGKTVAVLVHRAGSARFVALKIQ